MDKIRKKEDEASSRSGPGEEPQNRKLLYSFIDEYVDSDAEEVVAWLTHEAPARSILSLAGSRRTCEIALVSKPVHRKTARCHFDCCYWIDFSGLYKIEKLIVEVLEEKKPPDQETFRDLRAAHVRSSMKFIDKLIRHSVKRIRYMFILNDVFHQEFWEAVKQVLYDNDLRHWMIATDPTDDVKRLTNSSKRRSFETDRIRRLGPLSDTQSWELFCRIAFQDKPRHCCPMKLELLSGEIVKKCKGFPLPIVGVAGLLSKRSKKVREWKRVCDSFNLEVKTNLRPRNVSDVPPISLFDLPYHLWPCFMYFSLFQRDSVVPVDKLFKLWIAEGFVEENSKKTLEEVAEEYLNELVHRSLVRHCQGNIRFERFCRVDRLVYASLKFNAEVTGFGNNILANSDVSHLSKIRRLSIYSDEYVDPKYFDSQTHSLFLSGGVRDLSFLIDLIGNCEVLTVLDFENYPIEELPEELGKLFRLKYLSLKNTKLRRLPRSFDELTNLQTLDLRNTLLLELPSAINKLENLRHLMAGGFDGGPTGAPSHGVKVNKGIGSLRHLQTLTTVDAHRSGTSVMRELGLLNLLRTLGVSRLTAETAAALCSHVGVLGRLKSLTLKSKNGDKGSNLRTVPVSVLQRLVLKGRFRNLPDWDFRLQNVTAVWLSLTKLTDGQLESLSRLPNLVSLWLCRAYGGDRLWFKEGGFEKLKLLVLREFRRLNSLEIETGALARVEELRIGSSPLLNEVPIGIRSLKSLKLLVCYDMAREFVAGMLPDGGSHYWKVEHVASVFFLWRVGGREYELFELGDSELASHLNGSATNACRVTEPRDEHEFSFSDDDDDDDDDIDDDDDDVGQLNFSRDQSKNSRMGSTKRWSFSSGFYTDDVEQ